MTEYAIRIDIPKSEATDTAKQLTKYLKATKYLWCFELGTKTEKPHIHGYVLTDKKKDTAIKYFQRRKLKYSYVPVRNSDRYIDYTIKDMNIIHTNLDEEQIEQLIEKAQEIKEDKALKKADKIMKYVREKTGIHFRGDYEEMDTPEDEELVNHIVDWHLDKGLIFNQNQILSYFNYVKGSLTAQGRKQIKRANWLYINKYQLGN